MTDITYILNSNAYASMKKLAPAGIAGKEFVDKDEAAGYTYTTADGQLFSTPLIFKDNPYNNLVANANFILDVGCGIGRNLNWIMENTRAKYVGLDPNQSMLKYFWDWQNEKYKDRVRLAENFEQIPPYIKFDIIECTFVFQHIGYRTPADVMNITDITKKIMEYCKPDTVWILYEHQSEERWVEKWKTETGIDVKLHMPEYKGIEELTHRDYTATGGHDLIIAQGNGK